MSDVAAGPNLSQEDVFAAEDLDRLINCDDTKESTEH